MGLEDISSIIKKAKNINLDEVNYNDEKIKQIFELIYNFIQSLDKECFELLEKLSTSTIRFCDYYDSTNMHGEEIINYFNNNYLGSNIDDILEVFLLYTVLKNVQDLVYGYDLCESLDELYELLDNNYYFSDILCAINFIQNKKELKNNETDSDLSFLENSKYKILFSGFSKKDIEILEKNIKKAFIKKLSGQLSSSDIITLAESIDHVKDAYGIPIFRVQFANDYRIAYLRKDDVTVILGVVIKTGKPIDYTRYDFIAKNIDNIYNEVDLFNQGLLPSDSQHYEVVEQLNSFVKKIK